MDGWSRERETKPTDSQRRRGEGRTKAQNQVQTNWLLKTRTHARMEQRKGQERINGCALIDKLIKQTKTSAHTCIKTQAECKADTYLNNRS